MTEAHDPADDVISFHPEEPAPDIGTATPWRVLTVDDDHGFQSSTAYALREARILGHPIELVQAYSLAQAAHYLARDRDFAVIIADVVMETEDAGLRLVKGIRETLGLSEPRILLLTGQPGFAPIGRVMEEYDLTDYCLKSDLAQRGLTNILTAAIRSYQQLRIVSTARRGLQLILESSNRLAAAHDPLQYSRGVLQELATLLRVPVDGIVCVQRAGSDPHSPSRRPTGDEAVVLGAEGRFAASSGMPLHELPDPAVRRLIQQALDGRISVALNDCQVLFLPHEHALADYAIYLATSRVVDAGEAELLRVFASNVARGFGNVALVSRLDRLAYEDDLLKIPNRAALLREIDRRRITADGAGARLLVFDLDDFSGLNDAFGVTLGDRVLGAMLQRLRDVFRPPALVARISADLFGVVGVSDTVNLGRAGQLLSEPLEVDGNLHRLTAGSAEIALDAGPENAQELLRAAWGALRVAKSRGAGSAVAYDPSFEQRAGQRFELMARLGEALNRGELFLVFQPQVELASGRTVGAEALLRWESPLGPVSPAEFIPIAEQSSLIHTIGEFVIHRACEALTELAREGQPDLQVSVNVSARQFEVATLDDIIAEACRSFGANPRRLGLEVTETAVMGSFEQVVGTLKAHRARGGTVAIDDFGTGMSSLEYLLNLPADHLKIDRTFVSRLETDERSRTIARMIIDLGRTLGVALIAEGVETRWQAEWLRNNGCQYGQGWLFARPYPLPQFIAHCRAAFTPDGGDPR